MQSSCSLALTAHKPLLQAPSIREPDASSFSQILECSTASFAHPRDASPKSSPQTALLSVSTPSKPASASELANENEALNWRDQQSK